MRPPLVSVVMPNYNYGRFLPEALESVFRQTYPHVEIIVVDDGSTDDSIDVLNSYGSRVRAIRQRNRGASAARNRGIRESRGELVAFLDTDDVWLPEKIARQLELLRNPAVGMVCCELRYVDASGRSLGDTSSDFGANSLRELALFGGSGVPGVGSSAVVRKSLLEQVGLFDETLSTSADWDLCRKIACHSQIAIVAEPLVLYRQHERAMHRNVEVFERDMLRAFESMFRDPAASAVHPLRDRCYGNLYLTLAGSYFHARSPVRGMKFLVRAAFTWPPSLGYALATPLRRIGRLLPGGVQWDGTTR